MAKKVSVFILSIFLLINVCGCVAVLAGAAAGGGTAIWLTGKLTKEVSEPFEKSLAAAKQALKSMGLRIEKETITDSVAQIRSKYTDGRGIWVDIHPLTQGSSRIEVRVGAAGDKEVSRKIMDKICAYL